MLGWKEYELEVMRDRADNFVVICSIENFDPMGIHTGDSVTVAPAQTLTDREYQVMRNASRAIIREVGVETGGSNIQFAVDPKTGRLTVIEMNPRVSRSLGARQQGDRLPDRQDRRAARDRLPPRRDPERHHARDARPSFEPVIDYVVVKIPRWAFEKFRDASPLLGTQMKSVGEVMAIGRTFKEALHKGLRGLEIGTSGFAHRPRRHARRREAAHARPRPHLLREARARARLERTSACTRRPGSTPGSSTSSSRSWTSSARSTRRTSGRGPARGQALRLLGRTARAAAGHGRGRGARAAEGRRHRAGLQARRHLRGRVRVAHALPLLDLRERVRGGAHRPPEGADPGQRAEPHRPGHRVRLLLLPRRVRVQGRGLRDPHGELQPGDGLDRLRHLRPAVLRAAHVRGRDERDRAGEARGRRHPVRRADAAAAGAAAARAPASRSWAPAPTRSTWPRTASASARCSTSSASRSRRAAPPPRSTRRRWWPSASATRCWCGPRTCWAAARWRSSTTATPPRGVRARGGEGLARAPDPDRPLPGGRVRGGRGRAGRRRARGDRRHPAAHRAGRHPQRRLRHGAADLQDRARAPRDDPALHARAGPGARACAA